MPDALPEWFSDAFAHVSLDERDELVQLWRSEPALREFTDMLRCAQPELLVTIACPYCDNRSLVYMRKAAVHLYQCGACDSTFARSKKTPFHRLHRANYARLYATAVLLWGPWTPVQAWRIAGASDTGLFRRYRKRIAPLFAELKERYRESDLHPVSRPRYRLGFSPADQGISCPRCKAADMGYFHRTGADNPGFVCRACNYETYLQVRRRQLLPAPPDAMCARCGNRRIILRKEAGKTLYRCQDCLRNWVPDIVW